MNPSNPSKDTTMTRRRITIMALIAGVGTVGLGAMTHRLSADNGRHQGRHRGHGPLGHLCQGNVNDKLDRVSGYLVSELELTADQSQKWDAVVQAIQTSDLETLCPMAAETDGTATAKLSQLETALATGLETVQQVKPPFETFYSALSESQQQTLNDLMSHRHRR
jgi:homoserine dehydrogenase